MCIASDGSGPAAGLLCSCRRRASGLDDGLEGCKPLAVISLILIPAAAVKAPSSHCYGVVAMGFLVSVEDAGTK